MSSMKINGYLNKHDSKNEKIETLCACTDVTL